MPDSEPAIAVVGSLNVDYVARVGRLPLRGETVAAADLEIVHGGKGANQAIAAQRQECVVRLIGSVGDDDMGRSYIDYLKNEGIETDGIRQVANVSTGAAFISVDSDGENTIVVCAGANGSTSPDQIRARDPFISEADALLVQFE
ncbi:MAG: ribokinase, partial [Verrucomicrobiae bacterium]|nr:ribokinase [Verrucomicrobiae bacterium]